MQGGREGGQAEGREGGREGGRTGRGRGKWWSWEGAGGCVRSASSEKSTYRLAGAGAGKPVRKGLPDGGGQRQSEMIRAIVLEDSLHLRHGPPAARARGIGPEDAHRALPLCRNYRLPSTVNGPNHLLSDCPEVHDHVLLPYSLRRNQRQPSMALAAITCRSARASGPG